MMRKVLFSLLLGVLAFAAVFPCAADVDPILLDQPNSRVFECSEDLFFEVLTDPVIDSSTGGRLAENYFLFLKAEFLFLEETPWNGLDKNSFMLKHTAADGAEERYPLNYMMTAMLGMKNGWKTLSDQLSFASLLSLNLVFDVPVKTRQGWTLVFRPAERGGKPACEVEIPLRVQ